MLYQPQQKEGIDLVIVSYSYFAAAKCRLGFYARLDPDGWFYTTVTNVNPTAKQSKILNPYVSDYINTHCSISADLSQ